MRQRYFPIMLLVSLLIYPIYLIRFRIVWEAILAKDHILII